MTDILDAMDELEDDDFNFEEDAALNGEIVEFDTSVDLDEFEMTPQQAQDITDSIRSAATATFVLLAEAHKHKAHKALGYESWADYVREEFQISTQRSYQLLALSSVANEIESALPEGSTMKITEKQARDIKRELPKITEQIREETTDMSPDAAAARAAEIVEEHRDEIKAQKAAEDKAKADKEAKQVEAEREAYQAQLEGAADALLEADRPEGMTDSADDGLVEMEIDNSGDAQMSPENAMHVYNFFNGLSGILSLPEPDDFIATIPRDRSEEVSNKILEAASWMNRFQTLWEMHNED